MAWTTWFLATRPEMQERWRAEEEFDPDRWLEEAGSAPGQDAFLAFGAGPRFCPGRNLAFLEAKAALATIARNFELELDESNGPASEQLRFTMGPRNLRLRLRRRHA